ncbi:hypothetical protein FOL47_010865 [Perkinsus chesapeaki]|uniref:Uncharacterized protein n=1 Tax=Perkinsus chesapeaki TaxID=330153 RepID=A0A7J6L1T0_PERCH|nr:hypothetical protein FOL47_010865 [Perkinsus chesapeaki]
MLLSQSCLLLIHAIATSSLSKSPENDSGNHLPLAQWSPRTPSENADRWIESAVMAFEAGDSPAAVSILQEAARMGSLKAFTELALIVDPWQNHQLIPLAAYVDSSFRDQQSYHDECALCVICGAYCRAQVAPDGLLNSAGLGSSSRGSMITQAFPPGTLYLLLGILHDVGKTLSLTGEDDAYVDGSNLILSCPFEHAGLDACVVTYSHDEFGYQKFLECCPGVDLPEEFLYGVRYHSLHSVDPKWLSEKDVSNFAWLFDDFTVYDHEENPSADKAPLVPQIEGVAQANGEKSPRSVGIKQKIRDLQRSVETEVMTARKELAVLRNQEIANAEREKSGGACLSEEELQLIDKVKKDVLKGCDHFFDKLEDSFMKNQRVENKRLLAQVEQLKSDNTSLQLMAVELSRSISLLEEETKAL